MKKISELSRGWKIGEGDIGTIHGSGNRESQDWFLRLKSPAVEQNSQIPKDPLVESKLSSLGKRAFQLKKRVSEEKRRAEFIGQREEAQIAWRFPVGTTRYAKKVKGIIYEDYVVRPNDAKIMRQLRIDMRVFSPAFSSNVNIPLPGRQEEGNLPLTGIIALSQPLDTSTTPTEGSPP